MIDTRTKMFLDLQPREFGSKIPKDYRYLYTKTRPILVNVYEPIYKDPSENSAVSEIIQHFNR